MTGLRELGAPLREHARVLASLAVLLVFTYGYFVAAPAWNQNSRLALTRAMVEEASFAIDADHATTGDKSWKDGHFYSDKAPFTSVLAALPYAVFHGLRHLVGGELPEVRVFPLDPLEQAAGAEIEPEARRPGDRLVYNQAHRLALYTCGLFAVAIPSILGAAALYLMLLRRASARVAVICGLVYALGTPAMTYSTALYGHQLCASLLVVALAAAALPEPGRASRNVALVWGGTLAAAVATEYPAFVPAVAVGLWGVHRHGLRMGLWGAVAAAPIAVGLAYYHHACFGSPLATGYDFVYRPEFAEGMRVRYGFSAPDPQAMWALTFGAYRGLFYFSPVLLLAAWGLCRDVGTNDPWVRTTRLLALGVCAYFVLLNAGYYMWDGGAAMGPRHMVPMLPFLALGLPTARRAAPLVFGALAFVSVGQTLLATAASPEAAQYGNAIWEYAFGRVLGRLPGPDVGATNLGLLLGLPGPLSLVPLVGLWLWVLPGLLARLPERRAPQSMAGDPYDGRGGHSARTSSPTRPGET